MFAMFCLHFYYNTLYDHLVSLVTIHFECVNFVTTQKSKFSWPTRDSSIWYCYTILHTWMNNYWSICIPIPRICYITVPENVLEIHWIGQKYLTHQWITLFSVNVISYLQCLLLHKLMLYTKMFSTMCWKHVVGATATLKLTRSEESMRCHWNLFEKVSLRCVGDFIEIYHMLQDSTMFYCCWLVQRVYKSNCTSYKPMCYTMETQPSRIATNGGQNRVPLFIVILTFKSH